MSFQSNTQECPWKWALPLVLIAYNLHAYAGDFNFTLPFWRGEKYNAGVKILLPDVMLCNADDISSHNSDKEAIGEQGIGEAFYFQ